MDFLFFAHNQPNTSQYKTSENSLITYALIKLIII